jgi:arylsulfatase A-like enzyme
LHTVEGRIPAFWGRDDFDVEVLLEAPVRGVIRGAIGFAGEERQRLQTTRALFRILLRSPSGKREVTVLETEVESKNGLDFESFSAPLPDAWEGPARLRLEVRYQGKRRLRAAWINPVVEREELRREAPLWAPNLLLITSDTTRQDTLEVYGGAAVTPHLMALAHDGIIFRNAFSVAFGTAPSHTSLFSSSHPAEHGVYNNASIAASGLTTLAEKLREAGYSTAAFVGAKPVGHRLGLAQGFDLYDDIFIDNPGSWKKVYRARHERRAPETTAQFFKWLDETTEEGPFFVWLHFFDPHAPYDSPTDTTASTGAGASASRSDERTQDEFKEGSYRDEITFVDSSIGDILERLRGESLYDNTLIAFVADHGENLAERGSAMAFGHGGLYAGVARIPLILKLPSSLFAGSEQDFLLGNLDLAPTLVDLMGLGAPIEWSGKSFARLLGEGPGTKFRPHLILEGAHRHEISVRTPKQMYRELLPDHEQNEQLAQILGYSPEQSTQLFDLETDREELFDLASSSPLVVEELRSLARQFLAEHERKEAQILDSPAHLKALEALGYVNR